MSIEHNKTFVLLRNHDLHVHYKKIQELKTRKNSYLPSISLLSPHSKNTSDNNNNNNNKIFISPDRKFFIKRDNKYLQNKIFSIKNRNKNPYECDNMKKFLKMKQKAREALKKLNEEKLNKTNFELNERIKMRIKDNDNKDCFSTKNLKKDFLTTRKYLKSIKNVWPDKNDLDVYLTNNESNIFDNYCKNVKSNKNFNLNNNKEDDKSLKTKKKSNSCMNIKENEDKNKKGVDSYKSKEKCKIVKVKINKKILDKLGYNYNYSVLH